MDNLPIELIEIISHYGKNFLAVDKYCTKAFGRNRRMCNALIAMSDNLTSEVITNLCLTCKCLNSFLSDKNIEAWNDISIAEYYSYSKRAGYGIVEADIFGRNADFVQTMLESSLDCITTNYKYCLDFSYGDGWIESNVFITCDIIDLLQNFNINYNYVRFPNGFHRQDDGLIPLNEHQKQMLEKELINQCY